MTEKCDTKQEILKTALKLFSAKGYESTSVAEIADAVGIRKASLYSRFTSKKEILDELVQAGLVHYNRHSIFANADWDDPTFISNIQNITPDEAQQMITGHIRYILHDPRISSSRKMITIEQFQNKELSALLTKQNYTDVMRYFTGLMRFLIRQGRLIAGDPEIMAVQFCLPVSVWIGLCDREPEREDEVIGLIGRHIIQFFKMYGQPSAEAVGK